MLPLIVLVHVGDGDEEAQHYLLCIACVATVLEWAALYKVLLEEFRHRSLRCLWSEAQLGG
ncbi:hypothetical protein A3K78_02320 [Candidatus Bathyarchaeota archaeon RBG_13_52_12]|nr:MAG: hypothetical protein A3K78_02320 [Candidatus Bathyarchaeota archaeon RBG_13_52_12]